MRKKSGKLAAKKFLAEVAEIEKFTTDVWNSRLTEAQLTWAYEYAVIRLYRSFEQLMMNCLIAAINSDTSQLSKTTGVQFPEHLTDEVCAYVIVHDGYFDFKGRDGLIQKLGRFLTADHYLSETVKDSKFKSYIEQLSAFRNYAAHDSPRAKSAALHVANASRMSSAGAWLKKNNRFETLCQGLTKMAEAIRTRAPY